MIHGIVYLGDACITYIMSSFAVQNLSGVWPEGLWFNREHITQWPQMIKSSKISDIIVMLKQRLSYNALNKCVPCDMIKRIDSDVGDIVFEVLSKKEVKINTFVLYCF